MWQMADRKNKCNYIYFSPLRSFFFLATLVRLETPKLIWKPLLKETTPTQLFLRDLVIVLLDIGEILGHLS